MHVQHNVILLHTYTSDVVYVSKATPKIDLMFHGPLIPKNRPWWQVKKTQSL